MMLTGCGNTSLASRSIGEDSEIYPNCVDFVDLRVLVTLWQMLLKTLLHHYRISRKDAKTRKDRKDYLSWPNFFINW